MHPILSSSLNNDKQPGQRAAAAATTPTLSRHADDDIEENTFSQRPIEKPKAELFCCSAAAYILTLCGKIWNFVWI